MQPWRIDVADLKARIAKKIGQERSKRYFSYLNRLLSQELSKVEFDRLCFRVLGRENLPLHNQFIRSILKNACHAKSPPPLPEVGPAKSAVVAGNNYPATEDGRKQSGSMVPNQALGAPVWSNGVIPATSPRKGRSTIRDRKRRDCPIPLGHNGKADSVFHQSTATGDSSLKTIIENGNISPCDYQRPLKHNQGLVEQPGQENPKIKKSNDPPVSLHGPEQSVVGFFKDGDEVEEVDHSKIYRSPLLAPLGIPLCSASAGGARKALPVSSTRDAVSYFDCGGLSGIEMLRKRMEQIAAAQGMEGVSMECATMLNNTVDVYLKRLISSCIELVGARSGCEPKKPLAQKQHIQGKLVNGMWPSNHLNVESSSRPPQFMKEWRPHCSISLLDFKVAMELNPQQLGEDWPLLLEKINVHSFEE